MPFRQIGAAVDGAPLLRASWRPRAPFPNPSRHAPPVLSIAASSVSALARWNVSDSLLRDVYGAEPGESAVRGTQRGGLLAAGGASRRPSRSSTTEQ